MISISMPRGVVHYARKYGINTKSLYLCHWVPVAPIGMVDKLLKIDRINRFSF